jgi:iron complex transport system substrate-binding protein
MRTLFLTVLFACTFIVKGQSAETKIITLNGAVTEIVCALGFEKNIIATDVTSTYPSTLKVKDVGHVRNLSIETILSLKPSLVLGTTGDMKPEMISRIKAAGIKTAFFEQEFSVEGTKKLIAEVAQVLGKKNSKSITEKIDAQLKQIKQPKQKKKVMFVYARGAGTMMVAGTNTPMEQMMLLAGAENAVKGFADFKPLTPEALINANPDFILLFDSGLKSLGGVDGVLNIEGVSKTTAGKKKQIIAMDGALLSGFGPRLGEGVVQLNALLEGNGK